MVSGKKRQEDAGNRTDAAGQTLGPHWDHTEKVSEKTEVDH